MPPSIYGVSFDPFASGPLSDAEKAEIKRFIRVLDYEKHSGAEHRAAGCLMRLWNALEHGSSEAADPNGFTAKVLKEEASRMALSRLGRTQLQTPEKGE